MMLVTCKGLEQTLVEITKSILEGNLKNMPDLLEKRKVLLDAIQDSKPSLDEAQEIEDVLKSVISLEQLITELAKEKKEKIIKEMKAIRSHRIAHRAYGNQSLKGVMS